MRVFSLPSPMDAGTASRPGTASATCARRRPPRTSRTGRLMCATRPGFRVFLGTSRSANGRGRSGPVDATSISAASTRPRKPMPSTLPPERFCMSFRPRLGVFSCRPSTHSTGWLRRGASSERLAGEAMGRSNLALEANAFPRQLGPRLRRHVRAALTRPAGWRFGVGGGGARPRAPKASPEAS
jgi:hypothetical protein